MNKAALARKIQCLDGLDNAEKTALLELLRNTKKYGLVWEEKTEDIEERLRDEIPVPVERSDEKIHEIVSDNPDAPNHIILEGDNLASLTALSYTHSGKIDLIYIDPPYNTGNQDFVYNDSMVDSDDSFRHSKWLSFMSKRLRIAKRLLSERGIIFISIDDNEQANLKLLCDEIFGAQNFVSNFLWRKKSTTSNVKGAEVSSQCDYNLCYKNTPAAKINPRVKSKDERSFPYSDETGRFRTTVIEKKDAGAYQRDSMKFPILGHLPRRGKRWQIGLEKARELEKLDRFVFDGEKILLKVYDFEQTDTTSAQPNLLLEHGTTDNSARLVNNDILGVPELFSNPKPVELIKHFIEIGSRKDSVVLDFFAGSGTTLHATMLQNAKDKGKRICILCTNNENNICENVTYERNKRVIHGYTNQDGNFIGGLRDNSLHYYRMEFLPREKTVKNMRELVEASTGLLCIKNDLYSEAPFGGRKLNAKYARFFEKGDRRMLAIYDERAIPFIADTIASLPAGQKIIVYVFSHGSYAYDDEFADVADRVVLCPLPKAIYDAYRRVLPKRRPKFLEDELVVEKGEQE